MRLVLVLLLLSAPLVASWSDDLCEIDQQICCLEQRYIALMSEAHTLSETATVLYWHRNTESDVRSLEWRACRKRRAAGRVCCRIQKLRDTRAAIVRQVEKGVSYESCAG